MSWSGGRPAGINVESRMVLVAMTRTRLKDYSRVWAIEPLELNNGLDNTIRSYPR
jgi:hypothetical protein